MSVKLLYSIISLVLVVGSPVAFVIYLKKVKKVKLSFWCVLAGVVVEFLVKEALLRLAVYAIAVIPGLNSLLTNTLSYGLVTVLLTTLLLGGMALLVIKFYLNGTISIAQAASASLGAILADTMMTYLMPAFSNIIYIHQMNNGTLYGNLTEMVTAEQAVQVIDLYNSYPDSYFLYFGIIAFASVCSNYLISMLLVNKTNEDRSMRLKMLFATIFMVSVVFYFTNPITFSLANVVLLVFGISLFGFAHVNSKDV